MSNRDTTPGYGASLYNGLDSFNTSENNESSNWVWPGADAGLYTNNDIYAVRILAMEGVSHRSYPYGEPILDRYNLTIVEILPALGGGDVGQAGSLPGMKPGYQPAKP